MFKKIGIIGGTGKMGSMFEKAILKKHISCLVSDEMTQGTENQIIAECDLIILSVPIEKSKKVAKRIAPLLNQNQLWIDFTSVKAEVADVMQESKAEVILVHPLFGNMPDMHGQNIILIPLTSSKRAKLAELKSLFISFGLVVSVLDNWKEHDEMMSYIQGLMHFIHIVFTSTLYNKNIDITKLIGISSPVYRANFSFACRIIGRDPSLYTSILMDNKYNTTVLKDFLDSATQIFDMVQTKNHTELIDQLGNLKTYLSDMGDKFAQESDFLIDQMLKIKSKTDDGVGQ